MPEKLDQLDRQILKEIISPGSARWDVREPYSRIAGRLAVDEETVRRRLARMRGSGVIGKFVLFLNPRLLNRENGIMLLESTGDVPHGRAISRLKLMDGVVSLTPVHGVGLLVSVYYQGESSFARQIALIESICDARATMVWTAPYPGYAGRVTETDWSILKALRRDPRRSPSGLASEVGVSPRTFNRRVKRLIDGGAIFLFLEFDIKRIVGFCYLLIVRCDDTEKKRGVDRRILERLSRLIYAETWAPKHSLFAFGCENIHEADTISRYVRETRAVSEMRLGIIEERIIAMDWVDEEIQRRVDEARDERGTQS